MKRVYLAITFLGIIITCSILTIHMQGKSLSSLISATEEIETVFSQNDLAAATKKTEALIADFSKKAKILSLFSSHNFLTEAEKCIVTLPIYLKKGKPEDFLAELSRCRLLLKKQQETDLPMLKNIF